MDNSDFDVAGIFSEVLVSNGNWMQSKIQILKNPGDKLHNRGKSRKVIDLRRSAADAFSASIADTDEHKGHPGHDRRTKCKKISRT
jgi:hypothetical protein